MRSKRGMKRHSGSKKQLLTTGGINEYHVNPSDFKKVVSVVTSVPRGQTSLLLKSLLTERELADITRRILIAEMILAGKTYDEIKRRLRTGKGTIVFVKDSLRDNQGILRGVMESALNISTADKYIRNRLKRGK